MRTTNVALPGTVIPSGNLIAPGGGQGIQGIQGIQGPPPMTTTSGSFTVPAIGATTTVTVADASWMILGQPLFFDTAGGGTGLAGTLVVTAKSGNLLTLLNPTPPSGYFLASFMAKTAAYTLTAADSGKYV